MRKASIVILGSLMVVAAIFYFSTSQDKSEGATEEIILEEAESKEIYGYNEDDFYIEQSVIGKNEFLGSILDRAGISYDVISTLAKNAKDAFDVRYLREGKPYTIVWSNETQQALEFIYQSNPFRYVSYQLQEPYKVEVKEHKIETCVETFSGTIESSLWNSMKDVGAIMELISKMEDALEWSIDFQHVLAGDQYKLIYERQYINGEAVGIGKLIGAYFKNYDTEFYSIYFENEKYQGFYDETGRPMKKAFLKSPVRFSRISSHYNPRRFHPILKRTRPHYGTDYAAPYGTPIRAVADGVLQTVGFTRGNGNYIKIKHDKVYQSQYLHMSRFAKGMKSGVNVKQGQTIGYVGATGLATGPHVCFRFWKNGKQVNHLKQNLPPPDPLPESQLEEYLLTRDIVKEELDQIPIFKLESSAAPVDTSDQVENLLEAFLLE